MPQLPHHRRISSHPICCKVHSLLTPCLLGLAALLLTSCAGPSVSPSGAPDTAGRGALTTLQRDVDLLRNHQVHPLAENESVDLVSDDAINVHPDGRAKVTFDDNDLVVELFRGSQLEVKVTQQPAGFALLRLVQIGGHSETRLWGQVKDRIELVTTNGTLRPTEPDTDFAVCHKENVITCLVVFKGAVEMEAQGQVATAVGGTASYILAGQPPKPPICADIAQVRTWLDTMRSNSEEGNLGSIVQSWPQVPCDQVAAAPGNPAATGGAGDAGGIIMVQLPTPGAVPAATPTSPPPALPAPDSARFKYATYYANLFPCPAGVNGGTGTVNVELSDHSFLRRDGSYQAVWSQQAAAGGGALVSSIGVPSDLVSAGPLYLWIADRSGSRTSNIVDVGTAYGPWKSTYLDANHLCANISFVFTEASNP